MPVVYQKLIRRSDLQENPEVLYLFGDNAERQGLGGQAKEMRGEPNAVGIRTKRAPNNSRWAFFTEDPDDVAEQNAWIAEDFEPVFEHLETGGTVVIPTDGVGSGLARLREVSPSSWDFLSEQMERLRDY